MADVFISYRRTEAFIAERMHERLCSVFRSSRVFLDRSEIRAGTRFPDELAEALAAAKVVIVLIDPTWITVQDSRTCRRRLDLEGDWVRTEVQQSLEADKIVIPTLVDGAAMPTREQLPDPLVGLAERQFLRISRERFADDVDQLIDEVRTRISEQDLRELLDDDTHPYPKAGEFKPIAVEGELLDRMMTELPHWRVIESPLQDDPRAGTPSARKEIVRSFRFPSFRSAIRFMNDAAEPIDAFGHHPRWENVFKTVRVALSTWDIGHRPSDRDFKTAIMLERFYTRFLEREEAE